MLAAGLALSGKLQLQLQLQPFADRATRSLSLSRARARGRCEIWPFDPVGAQDRREKKRKEKTTIARFPRVASRARSHVIWATAACGARAEKSTESLIKQNRGGLARKTSHVVVLDTKRDPILPVVPVHEY